MASLPPSSQQPVLQTTTELPVNGTDEWEFNDYNQRILIAVVFIVISIVGFVGNLMVIIAVNLSRKLQTATNVFVLNTSCVDLLNCIFLPFNAVSMLSRSGWPLSPTICALSGGVSMVCLGATVVNLALIAFNRTYLIKNPRERYCKLYSPLKLGLMVLFAWLFPIMAFALPPAVGIGKLGYSQVYKVCLWDDEHELYYINDYIVIVTFLISFIIIIVCYTVIYMHVKHHNRRLQGVYSVSSVRSGQFGDSRRGLTKTNSSSLGPVTEKNHKSTLETRTRKANNKREIQITKNLFYVVCAFFICILPYPITLSVPIKSVADVYAGVLLMANSCVNPIIYSFKHPHFKVVFMNLLRCRLDEIPQPSFQLKLIMRSTGSDKQRSSAGQHRNSKNDTGSTR